MKDKLISAVETGALIARLWDKLGLPDGDKTIAKGKMIAEVLNQPSTQPERDADIVSRSYLLAEYDRLHKGTPGGARKIIAEAPSAQPERKVGKWIYNRTDIVCSKCNARFDDEIEYICDGMLHYCPNCGSYNGGTE